MNGRLGLICGVVTVLVFCGCNNFFHDLIPPEGDRIVSFRVPGQLREAVISDNSISVTVQTGTNVRSVLPEIKISPRATLIPVTFNYVQAAFPSADILSEVVGLYSSDDPGGYVERLIRRNPDFNVPDLNMPIDFSAPVDLFVVSAQGTMRRYTVYVIEENSSGTDTKETDWPKLLGLRFSKSDNPELADDALCWIYEDSRTVTAQANYSPDSDFSYALVPTFVILGERLEIDGVEIKSGESVIQFDKTPGKQTVNISVFREGKTATYTLNITFAEYWGSDGPLLLGLRFAKYDNPEIVIDALCRVSENPPSVSSKVFYPMEMDWLSFTLVPSFEILGDRMEVDGAEVRSGDETSLIQFTRMQMPCTQTKTLTVWRNGQPKDYILTVTFEEDPDTVRSITDFRFNKTENPGIAANAVASIVNTDNTGTITVQVFYSGELQTLRIPRFVSPGTVSVSGITQTSGASAQDFFAPLNYRVVSKNGLYTRTYTVRVEFVSLKDAAPGMLSFRFSQSLNPSLVRDTNGDIRNDTGFILIDVYYGGTTASETLVPEFLAEGTVTVFGSVQISAFSPQDFNRQVKYTVTHPLNPLFSRDYWVQTNFIRDVTSQAIITEFGFHPDENPGLRDSIAARIDQAAGKITVFAPVGSGVTARTMYPYFTAAGLVTVNGAVQTSGMSGHLFDGPVTYTVESANGLNRREYTVEVRELTSTIFVDHKAVGAGDGTNWENAFRSLAVACEAAAQFADDVPKEIWIATGTYTPWGGTGNYFRLVSNTAYIGGFAGIERAKSERDVAANTVTVTSNLSAGLFFSDETLDGEISFENLRLNGAERTKGAGVYAVLNDGARVSIQDCEFSDLTAGENGGAVYVEGGGADIRDTVFSLIGGSGSAVYLNCQGETAITAVTVGDSPGTAFYLGGNGNKKLETVSVGRGGGIRTENTAGDLEISGLVLRDIAGTGIFISGSSGRSILSGIDGQNISGNAVNCQTAGSFTLTDGVFNSAGSVTVSSAVSVTVRNTVINGYTGLTVPLQLSSTSNGNITVDTVTVNGSPNSGGMNISSGGTVTVTGSVIRNTGMNEALNYSGNGSLRVENLELRDITGMGVYIAGSGGTKYLSGIDGKNIAGNAVNVSEGFGSFTVVDSEFDSAGAVSVAGGTTSSVTVQRTKIYNSTVSGTSSAVNVTGGTVTVGDVTVNGVTNGRGMTVDSGNTARFSDCVIRNTGGDGLTLSGNGEKQINDLVIRDITGSAVYMTGSGVLTVNGLELKDITGRGVYKTGGGVSLSGIDADGISGYAVYCYGTSSDSVTLGGYSKFNNTGGVYLSFSDLIQVTDTEIYNSTGTNALSVSSGSAATTIARVTVDGVPNGRGISASSTNSVQISGTQIRNCTTTSNGAGISFSGSGSSTVNGLVLQNITGRGIYKLSGGGVSLSGIDANGISNYAVYCSGISSGSVTLGGNSKFNNTGEVYISSSVSVQVTDTEIYNSTDASALSVSSGSATATIARVTIDGVPNGRGILANSDNSVQISGSQIRNCTTTSNGGGIYLSGSGNIDISNTSIKDCTANRGGGIYSSDSGNRVVSNVTIENCRAGSGGGIYFSGGNIVGFNVTIENCTATGSTATYGGDGGGIYLSEGKISSVTIKNCTAGRTGGGIFHSGNSDISDVTIENCTAEENGGGVGSYHYIYSSGNTKISSTTIKNCTAERDGGGIYTIYYASSSGNIEISSVTIENCTTTGNATYTGYGGGIYFSGSGDKDISNTTIENCTAGRIGGGIYFLGSGNTEISGTTIKNTVANDGGGLYNGSTGKLVITNNSRFENCRSMNKYGAIYSGSKEIDEITNTYFINCTSQNDYKILDASSFAFIRNCTFTHDNNLVNMGSPSVTDVISVFGFGGGNFEGCIFNNLKGNMTGANYLFNRYHIYANTSTGSGGTYYYSTTHSYKWTLKNCTFNFNAGSAGLCALFAGNLPSGSFPDYLLVDGCTINNNGGQQPLIWLNGNDPAGTFQFRRNNYYNGSLLDEALILSLGTSGLVRITGGAMPVIVP